MSTCSGAPAPHNNCPHGDSCDWEPRPNQFVNPPPKPMLVEMDARMMAFGSGREPHNRADRRKLQKAAKKIRSQERGTRH